MLGQLLDASVIGRSGENSIRLRLDGFEVRAATALPLREGDRLTLKVTQLKPVVTLSPATAQSPEKTQVRAAMSQALPKQQTLAPLLNRMSAMSKPATPQTARLIADKPLPTTLAQATHKVLRTIPSLLEISDAARLPGALRRIGSFAESTVRYQDHPASSQTELPERDLKWQLLRLRGEIRTLANQVAPKTRRPQGTANPLPSTRKPQGGELRATADRVTPGTRQTSPPASPTPATGKPQAPVAIPSTIGGTAAVAASEAPTETNSLRTLTQIVESAIAKIETNQLRTVGALLDGDFRLVFDLPVAVEDAHEVIQMQISQEGAESDGEEPTTTIVIEVPVSADTTLRAVVSTTAEELSIKLWSTDLQLRQTIGAHRETLEQRLRANGLAKIDISLTELKPFDEWGKKLDTLVDVTA